ncbi:hypothetical protein J2R96_005167 [Bradyrhizobium elkanii]|nr:hypothetical protein [Bradyrhizobium elkanii]
MTTNVEADRAKMTASGETKAAIKYLIATGSTAISILEHDGACQIRVGHKIDPDAYSVHWLREPNAIAVSRKARKEAGERPDVATMINALREAAVYWGETLTPHDLALQRATDSIKRLDAIIEALRSGGQLNIFNENYCASREAAASAGIGFMPYEVALSRLRMALVPYVTEGKRLEDITELFPKIFGPPELTDYRGLAGPA